MSEKSQSMYMAMVVHSLSDHGSGGDIEVRLCGSEREAKSWVRQTLYRDGRRYGWTGEGGQLTYVPTAASAQYESNPYGQVNKVSIGDSVTYNNL